MKQTTLIFFLVAFSLSNVFAQSQQVNSSTLNFTVPRAPWTISISGGVLVLDDWQTKLAAERGYFVMNDTKNEMTISLFIEPVVKCKTSKECRDFVWKSGNPMWKNLENIVQSEIGEISTFEFFRKEVLGRELKMQDMYAEFVVDNYWVDLHISKVLYKPEDHALFEQLVKSVKFETKKNGWGQAKKSEDPATAKLAKETLKYASQGSAAYLERDLKKAIQYYSKALELEKKEPTLDKNIWIVVVDNLGMSYGISGDNKKAKEIFEYGLSKDDTYPLFYYNLACAHAEMNDVDTAIKNLRLAYKFQANMIPGEHLPNPATDSSFTRFLNNEKFVKALKEMQAN